MIKLKSTAEERAWLRRQLPIVENPFRLMTLSSHKGKWRLRGHGYKTMDEAVAVMDTLPRRYVGACVIEIQPPTGKEPPTKAVDQTPELELAGA